MHRGKHSVLAALLVLASQSGDSACEGQTPKACEIDTRGIQVEHGLVTDVIIAIRPDAEGFRMPVNAGRCVPGQYRAAWQATGTGPHPGERPFNYTDGDFWGTTLDCEEG